LYASARVAFMLFPDWLGLDADLQHGVDARDCDGCRKETVQSYRDHYVPFVVDVVLELLRVRGDRPKRRKGGTYPLSHLYGHFGLVRLSRLGHDVSWVKA
jgi:hypothetical protein